MVTQQCECPSCHGTVHLKLLKMVNFILCIFYHNFKKPPKPQYQCRNPLPQNPAPSQSCPGETPTPAVGPSLICGHLSSIIWLGRAGAGVTMSQGQTRWFIQGQRWAFSVLGFLCVCSASSSLPGQVRTDLNPGCLQTVLPTRLLVEGTLRSVNMGLGEPRLPQL